MDDSIMTFREPEEKLNIEDALKQFEDLAELENWF
jgi:hypothetical protein